MTPTTRDRALRLWRLGLNVVPIPFADGGRFDGKVPAIAWTEWQHRRQTEADVCALFTRASNLAIVTGEVSGVVVIDADAEQALRWCARRLPYTPWQTKTPRGWHLFYRHPGGRIGNRARVQTTDGRLALDVRGDGGYVIAPGSIHASGAPYLEAGDWSTARETVPRFWRGWFDRQDVTAVRRRPVAPYASPDVIERARAYLNAIPRPEIGAGSDAATLYAACRLVRGFALSDADAIDLLWQWAGARPRWTRAWIAEKVAHARRYGTEPIGGLVS